MNTKLTKVMAKDLLEGSVIYEFGNAESFDEKTLSVSQATVVVNKLAVISLSPVEKVENKYILIYEFIGDDRFEGKTNAVVLDGLLEVYADVPKDKETTQDKPKPGRPKKRIDG